MDGRGDEPRARRRPPQRRRRRAAGEHRAVRHAPAPGLGGHRDRRTLCGREEDGAGSAGQSRLPGGEADQGRRRLRPQDRRPRLRAADRRRPRGRGAADSRTVRRGGAPRDPRADHPRHPLQEVDALGLARQGCLRAPGALDLRRARRKAAGALLRRREERRDHARA